MSRAPQFPDHLRHGPFSRAQALEAGLTSRQLQGRHLRRLLPQVFVHVDHAMTHLDHIHAADLATPTDAVVSHVSRIQSLGLDIGPHRPVHLLIARDHHLELPGVFLHRTERPLPASVGGLTGAAAFITCAATMRTIDLIVIGDWLLRRGLMQLGELRLLTARDPWRPGVDEATWVSRWLDARSASPQESRMRAPIVFSGLPAPELNVPLTDDPDGPVGDAYFRAFRTVAEFEGGHHFTDRLQIARDIGRYATMRDLDIAADRVTDAMLDQPRAMVMRLHALLVRRGYDGPAPQFGELWDALFEPARFFVARHRRRIDADPWAVPQQRHRPA